MLIAAKFRATVTKDHRLEGKVPRAVAPGAVEVILVRSEREGRHRAKRRSQPDIHPAADLWAKRADMGDSSRFAAALRRRLEARRDARR